MGHLPTIFLFHPRGAQGPAISKVFCAPARSGSSLRPRPPSARHQAQREEAVSGPSAMRILRSKGSPRSAREGHSRPITAMLIRSTATRLPTGAKDLAPCYAPAGAGEEDPRRRESAKIPREIPLLDLPSTEMIAAEVPRTASGTRARVPFRRCLRAPAQKGVPTPELIRPPCARVRPLLRGMLRWTIDWRTLVDRGGGPRRVSSYHPKRRNRARDSRAAAPVTVYCIFIRGRTCAKFTRLTCSRRGVGRGMKSPDVPSGDSLGKEKSREPKSARISRVPRRRTRRVISSSLISEEDPWKFPHGEMYARIDTWRGEIPNWILGENTIIGPDSSEERSISA